MLFKILFYDYTTLFVMEISENAVFQAKEKDK